MSKVFFAELAPLADHGLLIASRYYKDLPTDCALLTCYIQGPHTHIHFVDAGGGGYAMAAKQLKAQNRAVDLADHARLLGQVDLFKGLEKVTLAKLAAHLQPQSYKPDSIIFRQADPGEAFYLVASGWVGVYTTDRSGVVETRVKVLQPGEPFGEML